MERYNKLMHKYSMFADRKDQKVFISENLIRKARVSGFQTPLALQSVSPSHKHKYIRCNYNSTVDYPLCSRRLEAQNQPGRRRSRKHNNSMPPKLTLGKKWEGQIIKRHISPLVNRLSSENAERGQKYLPELSVRKPFRTNRHNFELPQDIP